MSIPVSFKTKDGVTIKATYCAGNAGRRDGSPRRGALLLHMMPATKESWSGLGSQLVAAGFSVLAIDFRGHGQSTVGPDGGKLQYRLFNDKEHQAKILDVEAAVDWLMRQAGIDRRSLAIVGASIGANLAVNYAADHPEVPVTVALSPGWDYHGVTTPDKIKKMGSDQKLYLAASEEDDLSFRTNADLAKIKPNAVWKKFRGAGHGTNMFEAKPGFLVELAQWLINNVPEMKS